MKALTGCDDELELLRRAEIVEDQVPGASDVMQRVIDGTNTDEDTVCAGFIALSESSLMNPRLLTKKISSVCDTTSDNTKMLTRLGMIRELFDTALTI